MMPKIRKNLMFSSDTVARLRAIENHSAYVEMVLEQHWKRLEHTFRQLYVLGMTEDEFFHVLYCTDADFSSFGWVLQYPPEHPLRILRDEFRAGNTTIAKWGKSLPLGQDTALERMK